MIGDESVIVNLQITDVHVCIFLWHFRHFSILRKEDTKEIVYIDKDFPNEFAGSKDTHNLRGTSAKAKANTAQCIPQMIEIASNKQYKENFNDKHRLDAKYGWYRYDTRVGIPVFSDAGEIERYNIFRMEVLIRHSHDGKSYLYDVVNIKKETSNPLEQ